MIHIGKNIKNIHENLESITPTQLAKNIKCPELDTNVLLRQLGAIRDLDQKKYAALKLQLPYFVCACSNPANRKQENFAFIQYFIVDFDMLRSKEVDIDSLRNKLQKDTRTVMAFSSVGGDGLKVMFRLKEKCYDPCKFSMFHFEFVKSLSRQYQVEQATTPWSDNVFYACFMSCDDNVYYNAMAEGVDIKSFLDEDNTQAMFDKKHEYDTSQKKTRKEECKEEKEPGRGIMDKIRKLLNFRQKSKPNNPVYVPDELNKIIDGMRMFLEDQGIVIAEIKDIQYGKKIRCSIDDRQAEVNVFYGKKGFSVIPSPKSGTDNEANQMLAEVIRVYIDDL